jgi:hypothetical protein
VPPAGIIPGLVISIVAALASIAWLRLYLIDTPREAPVLASANT